MSLAAPREVTSDGMGSSRLQAEDPTVDRTVMLLPRGGHRCSPLPPSNPPAPSRGPKCLKGPDHSTSQHGEIGCYITLAFSGVPNKGTESEVVAIVLPSWGPRENAKKKREHVEYKHMG